jgi:uncharacterized protein YkwD
VKRRVVNLLPLLVVVCLLSFVTTIEAQKKAATNTKTTTSTKTVSKNNVPPTGTTAKTATASTATVAPKTATATTTGFMSQVEQEVLDEMNLARADPQKYAGFVEEFKKYYDGNRLVIPGRRKALVTNEGIPAVDEAITFLRNQKPLPPLSVSKGLCLAAKDHANDLATKGLSGHLGSDGSLPNARVDRYGDWEGSIGETVVYEINPARQIVISLIIDDGTPNRGHRRNIFDSNYKVAGVSIVESPANGARCVVDYVGGFKEKAASNR